MIFKSTLAALLLCSLPAFAADYTVDTKASTITFSGTHADNPFTGTFSDWNTEIAFDPANLKDSHIKATLHPASAKTGNKMYDGTMPQDDWFDVKKFPDITFASTSIKENPDKSYTATGDLTLRGITHPADLVFTITDLNTTPVIAKGKITIDRLTYDVGKKSDGEAEWVGKEITIDIDLKATKK